MKPLLLLFLLSIVLSSCNDKKPSKKIIDNSKIVSKELLTSPKLDSIIQIDSTRTQGQMFTAYCTAEYFLYILNESRDTVFSAPEMFPDFEFADFNNDKLNDIRIYYMTNVPGIQDLILYDSSIRRFKKVEDFTRFPTPEPIKGTHFYYSYHRSGCADSNWDSDLFYIKGFKAVRIGNISGIGCGDKNIKDGVFISKINRETDSLLTSLPITIIDRYKNYKWGFIKNYWTKNYKRFL